MWNVGSWLKAQRTDWFMIIWAEQDNKLTTGVDTGEESFFSSKYRSTITRKCRKNLIKKKRKVYNCINGPWFLTQAYSTVYIHRCHWKEINMAAFLKRKEALIYSMISYEAQHTWINYCRQWSLDKTERCYTTLQILNAPTNCFHTVLLSTVRPYYERTS